jgi:glycosyltransferase involved in cell wall biosynthesis
MNAQRFDIVFLITGKPLPANLDLAYCAQKSGLRTLMIIFERGHNELIIDPDLVNFTIKTIDVSYKRVDMRRLLSAPSLFWKLRNLIVRELTREGVIVAGAYDLLVMARLLAMGRRYRIRHQVRDLHRLQLSGSLLSTVFVAVEALMLRRVERLLVSSPAFWTGYYARIFSGPCVLLENTPSATTWCGFRRQENTDGILRVGFVGIIRYPRSLAQLIDAVQHAADEGAAIKVIFAGGGVMPVDLQEKMHQTPELFEFSGPYQYTRDIKRLYANIDIIYAIYDGEDRNCQLAMPNKFYEAIIAKIPILVARGTYVESEVLRLGIGASATTGDAGELQRLLKEAQAGTGWYANALERLHQVDAEHYFHTYRRALAASVAP